MAANVQFSFDLDQFNHVMDIVAPEKARLALTALLSGSRYLILRHALLEAPVRTGNLRRSGHSDIDKENLTAVVAFGGQTLRDASRDDYAGIVSTGSRPHPIYPNRASALRFIPNTAGGLVFGQRLTGTAKKGWEAMYIFRNYVLHHPGTQPNPFLERGYQNAQSDMTDLMGRVAVRFMRAEQQNDEEEAG